MENTHPIPKSIESEWDFISGELICSECKARIIDYGYEDKERMSNQSIISANNHFCLNIKFDYNFNSPLTIREQYLIAKTKQSNAIKSPTIKPIINSTSPPPTERQHNQSNETIEDRRKRLGCMITIRT